MDMILSKPSRPPVKLSDYVEKKGGLVLAAKSIGVNPQTVWRWLHPDEKTGRIPRGLSLSRLKKLGIEI